MEYVVTKSTDCNVLAVLEDAQKHQRSFRLSLTLFCSGLSK